MEQLLDSPYAIVIIIIALFVLTAFIQRFQIKRGARKILKNQKALYSMDHEYVSVDPSSFRRLDLPWYDRTRSALEGFGYRFVDDLEDVTITTRFPSMRTFIRCMVSGDGSTVAGMYHFKPRGLIVIALLLGGMNSQYRILDLETEFSDGTFLCLSNSRGVDRTGDVPGIRRVQLQPSTPFPEMLEQHKSEIQHILTANRSLKPVPIFRRNDLIRSQNRLQALKNAHKKLIGYMDHNEMAKIAGNNLRGSGDAVADEIERLKLEEKDKPYYTGEDFTSRKHR